MMNQPDVAAQSAQEMGEHWSCQDVKQTDKNHDKSCNGTDFSVDLMRLCGTCPMGTHAEEGSPRKDRLQRQAVEQALANRRMLLMLKVIRR